VAHLRGKTWGDGSHMGAHQGSASSARARMHCSGAGWQRAASAASYDVQQTRMGQLGQGLVPMRLSEQ
jgi:hypothetical protein